MENPNNKNKFATVTASQQRAPSQAIEAQPLISKGEETTSMSRLNIQAQHNIHPSRATISLQDDDTLHRHLVSESRLMKEEKRHKNKMMSSGGVNEGRGLINSGHHNISSGGDMLTIYANQ